MSCRYNDIIKCFVCVGCRVEALIVRSEISNLEMQPFGLLFGVENVAINSYTKFEANFNYNNPQNQNIKP